MQTTPPQVQYQSDIQLFDQILERASKDQLEDLRISIEEEKELRRLKDHRIARLKTQIKDERQRMLNSLVKLRDKMTQNMEETEDDEDEPVEPIKKVVKRKK